MIPVDGAVGVDRRSVFSNGDIELSVFLAIATAAVSLKVQSDDVAAIAVNLRGLLHDAVRIVTNITVGAS